jgi:hypothetical protein
MEGFEWTEISENFYIYLRPMDWIILEEIEFALK